MHSVCSRANAHRTSWICLVKTLVFVHLSCKFYFGALIMLLTQFCFENRSNSIWNSLNAICFFWSLNYFSSNFRRRLYNIFGNEWWARSKSFQKEIACKAKYDTYLFSAMLMTYKIRMNEWTNFKINFKVSLNSLKLSIIAP